MVSPSNGFVILSDGCPSSRVEGSAVAFRKVRNGAKPVFGAWLKAAEAAVLALVICFSLGATDASSRFNDLGHRLMCTCGCAQLLGECNHVGCPESGHMRDELTAAIGSGLSDQQILDGFAAKYGATVLAAPTTKGFDLVAWIAPFAVFAAALMGTFLLIRRWGGWSVRARVAGAQVASLDPAEAERLSRVRRETGGDGGVEK
jgi:cytochrome c-type biogenesis protein CcmH/NrfF